MKARVDSKEFSVAIAHAMKWTKVTGVDVSGLVMLRAIDDYLLIRTTVLDGDSIVAVNAFDVEHGDVITRASVLREFSWATGGWLTIEHDGKKLSMGYEDFASPEIGVVPSANFPVMLDIPHQVRLTCGMLLAAASHTRPFAETGLPIKSSVHIIPTESGIAVLGADGIIGYMGEVEGIEIESSISIEAKTLSLALGAVGDMASIGMLEYRVEVAARDAPSRIQFSSVACPDPSNLVDFFATETHENQFEISKEEMGKLRLLAAKSAAADSGAELLVQGTRTVTGEILGVDISIPEFELGKGTAVNAVFRCDNLSRALSMLLDADVYTISTVMYEDKPRFWFIEGDGTHFIMAAAPVRFKERVDTFSKEGNI